MNSVDCVEPDVDEEDRQNFLGDVDHFLVLSEEFREALRVGRHNDYNDGGQDNV